MEGTLQKEITKWKRKRNAVILAHNYQLGEVQDLADFTGDSLELSIKAASLDCEVLVFCGVRFMAETAKILSPSKTVLLPVLEAGCPMADMISREELVAFKKEHPKAITVCYVNSTAEVKAECDIAVTSANAERIISSLPPERQILFIPDRHLGAFVQTRTGRRMVLWPGYCPTHARITPQDIQKLRKSYPDAVVLVHPECPLDTIAEADKVLSTGGMCAYVRTASAKRFIIATELGIIHRLRKENPYAEFIPVSPQAICPNMKRIQAEDVLYSLQRMEYPIELSEEVRKLAEVPLRRMLAGRIE